MEAVRELNAISWKSLKTEDACKKYSMTTYLVNAESCGDIKPPGGQGC